MLVALAQSAHAGSVPCSLCCRAAFQFGVKMKDGRKQGSLKKKTAAAENDKFEKQWQQIQKVGCV
jgi:hypothetical protein